MGVEFKMLTSPQEYERRLLKAFGEVLHQRFRQRHGIIVKKTQQIIKNALTTSSVSQSLLFGKLKSDFGLTDTEASSAVAGIIDTVINRISVSIEQNNIRSHSIIVTLLADDVIPSIVSTYRYFSDGKDIPWADWLLLQGTRIVINNFSVQENDNSVNSRSGDSVMAPGGFFRVDPEFAGTRSDNWISRAISSQSKQILQIVGESLGS